MEWIRNRRAKPNHLSIAVLPKTPKRTHLRQENKKNLEIANTRKNS
jgi:hypothetical protein